MEELFDSLKNWGCDVDGALARFIGDRELYRSCLHTAAGDHSFNDNTICYYIISTIL